MFHSTLHKAVSDPDMSICASDDSVSPLNTVSHRVGRRAQNVAHTDKLYDETKFQEFKMEMRQLITTLTNTHKEEMRQLNLTMKDIQDSNKSIEQSLINMSAQNEELKQEIKKLEKISQENREYIIFLEDKLDNMQLANRKTNFEIKGVPKKESETKQDLIDMVITLSETIDCKVSKSDIKDIYRVRSKKPEQRNTPIVVETGSVLLKTDFLKMAKSFNIKNKSKLRAKHLGFKTLEDTPIFVLENLTQKAARLHFLARDLTKSKSYKFVWTSYGKVYVRKSENTPIIMIQTEEQVHKLLLEQD
ncbi:hypothetical protein NE865_06185 [Phthorimaea operculella]|nr:hypothetical protein NE865_06185 [Phthorimaea operculella]